METWLIERGKNIKMTELTVWREIEYRAIPEEYEYTGKSLGTNM